MEFTQKGKEFTIRPITSLDIPGYAALHCSLFRSSKFDPTLEVTFQWKLYKNPQGAVQGAVAISDNKIVGIYIFIPINIDKYGEIHDCYEVVASSVHPDYQGKYIFHKLFYKVREICADLSNNLLLFGFPNERAVKVGQRSFGYRKISNVREYVKIFDYRALLIDKKNSSRFKFLFKPAALFMNIFLNSDDAVDNRKLHSMEVKNVSELPLDYECFWREAKKRYGILAIRDRAYLNWRFF